MSANDIVMNKPANMAMQQEGETFEEQRLHRQQRLAAALRIFGKFGFDEGVAGHITVRDPENANHFWVNPMGKSFKRMKVSDLICVNHEGEVIAGGGGLLNGAAFTIHAAVHHARPDVVAACHSHSVYGKAYSALRKPLKTITQDACAFYNDHAVFEDYTGVVLDEDEGSRIAQAIGDKKACILSNHGLLTTGGSVEAAAWWFVAMERSCQAQLLADAAGDVVEIDPEQAEKTHAVVGSELAGWFSFQPLFEVITHEQPDLLD